jgi:hypothetical protein
MRQPIKVSLHWKFRFCPSILQGSHVQMPSPAPPPTKCLMKCLRHPGATACRHGPRFGLHDQGAVRHGVRLGRSKARPRHNAGVRWPGTHACTRPRARRAAHPPDSRGHVRRGEVRCPTLTPANNQARVEARLPHGRLPAQQRRAQGHGLPRSSSSSRAGTRAARLAGGKV